MYQTNICIVKNMTSNPGHVLNKYGTVPNIIATVPDKAGTVPDKVGAIPDIVGTISDWLYSILVRFWTMQIKIFGHVQDNAKFVWNMARERKYCPE